MKKLSLVLAALTIALSVFMYGCGGSDDGKISDLTDATRMTTTQNITTGYATDTLSTSAAPDGLLGTDASGNSIG